MQLLLPAFNHVFRRSLARAGAGVELPGASPHLPATTNLTGIVEAA
jgi:hypothetical protein